MFRFGDPGGRMYTSVGTSGANILAHWTTYNPAASSIIVSASNGRNGGSCLRFNQINGANLPSISKTLDSQATWGLAFALKIANAYASGTAIIAVFEDTGSSQVDLRLNTDGTLSVTRNGTALTGGTSSAVAPLNTWTHFELKVKIDPSAGTVELRKNGVAIIGPLTGLNTRATANSSANGIRIAGSNSAVNWGQNVDFDDIIIWDTQTTDANGFADIHDFIGDCGLVWLLPTGAGTTTQWTPDSGSNYARVNEATPDGDTSYVSSSTVGQIDTYAMADLAASASAVKSVATVSYARKDDVGSRGMKTELRSGGGNTAHATEIALGNSYLYNFQNWGQNPNNGSAINWTVSAVNALEAGQTVSS